MYSELSKALNEVVSFTNKHRITAKFNIHSVGDLQGKNGTPDIYWATFEKKAGVYILLDVASENSHYIGMSESDIGTRLYNWLYKENNIKNAVTEKDIVFTINLTDEPYMSRALEAFLIERLNPILNKRRI